MSQKLALHLAKLGVDMLITDKPQEIIGTLGIEAKKNMATELLRSYRVTRRSIDALKI